MTTPRIEEMVEILAKKLHALETDWMDGCYIRGEDVDEMCDHLRTALTEAHQAGIDEAVEKLNYYIKHDIQCAVEFEAGDCDCELKDTIKALQDTNSVDSILSDKEAN